MKRIADNSEEQIRIAVLYCQHTVCRKASVAPAAEKVKGITVRAAMMPCSSKVQASHLLKILDQEADGVEVVACADQACRFLNGSRRAAKRVAYTRRLLDEVGVGAERVGISREAGASAEQLMELAVARAAAVEKIGNNGESQ